MILGQLRTGARSTTYAALVEAKKKFIVLIQKYETNPTSSRKDADDCPKIYSFVYLF